MDEARAYLRRACSDHPGYSIRVYERSFPHKLASHCELMTRALRRLGFQAGDG